jgi:hypothetical protein
LKERLRQALDKKLPKHTDESLAKKKAAATEAKKKNTTQGLSSFSEKAFWKELKPNQAVVQEPTNPSFKIQRVHAPTIPQEDAAHVPVKHNFDHTFDVPPLAHLPERQHRMCINRTKRKRYKFKKILILYDKRTNAPITKVVTRTCAVINPAFSKEENLSKKTKPHEFANIFLPLKNKIKTGASSFSFHKMMQWTHTKTVFADAGNSYYKNEYYPFSIDQIRSHSCAFYILHGLSPSPRAEYKFNPQRVGPV